MTTISQLKEKTVFRWVLSLSIVVFIAVIVLNRKVLPRPEPVPEWAYLLPTFNAIINATCSLLLIFSYRAIRSKRVETHKKLNLTAFFLSAIFLIFYVLYHWMADETRYPEGNPLRPVYLFILISHIILAAMVLPLVLMSFYYGLNNQVQKHRKLTRWSFPIWLYVTISGVVVYLMISPFYPH